jgi:NADH-quinone oxidoreductase subunit J
MSPFLFWFFALMMLVFGAAVIINRNPVASALSLVVSFLALAALFISLNAYFIGIIQVLVYAGAIMVLFLFVIMLVNLERSEREKQFNQQWLPGILAAMGLGALFVSIYVKGNAAFPMPPASAVETENTQRVGQVLYSNYMFPFEIASLLLLVAIIGAVVMAKKRI